jgi:hypothetical protein
MKMKILLFAVPFIVLFSLIYFLLNQPFGTPISLTFEVVDDLGQSVPEANIRGYLNDPRKNDDSGKNYIITTGLDGSCRVLGMGYSFTECTVYKDGYYSSRYHLKLKENGEFISKLTLVLKKVRNPKPMLFKKVSIIVPELNKRLGYDLLIGDWVEPYGRGLTNDFIFNFSGEFKSFNERKASMGVSYAKEQNGIQSKSLDLYSQFKTVYMAPINSYSNNYDYTKKIAVLANNEINPMPRDDIYFIFKVRGEKVDAVYTNFLYGVILSDFLTDYADEKNIGVYFNYYINPIPNDNSVEWNGSNLFNR